MAYKSKIGQTKFLKWLLKLSKGSEKSSYKVQNLLHGLNCPKTIGILHQLDVYKKYGEALDWQRVKIDKKICARSLNKIEFKFLAFFNIKWVFFLAKSTGGIVCFHLALLSIPFYCNNLLLSCWCVDTPYCNNGLVGATVEGQWKLAKPYDGTSSLISWRKWSPSSSQSWLRP